MRFIFLFFILNALNAKAEEKKYPVSAIPDSLKQGASIVFRMDVADYSILAKDRASWHVHQVITILHSDGKRRAVASVPYDKLSKVDYLKAFVYDAEGTLIKKLKNSEIQDISYSSSSLFQDNRLKVADATQTQYPYTVEFEYEVEYRFLFHIPGWEVVSDEKTAVEFSSYSLIFPSDLAPRYRIINSTDKVIKKKLADGKESYTWEFRNIKPVTIEPYGLSIEDVTPIILAAPTKFEFSDYAGQMDTWKSFGLWIKSLNDGRDILPEETRLKIRELTKDKPSTEEKVKVLYEFLQNKTRYVSIQLGIGGFQPFEASVVDKTSYGDCKALSNYMVALLKEAGIPANYILIRAGSDASDIRVDFPSTQFNHAIVAVPNKNDTLWLECTSQTNPFGYMGRFTGNRHALMINEGGGYIIHTPVYKEDQNIQSRSADVVVLMTGDATAKVSTTYQGLQYENHGLDNTLSESTTDQKEWVLRNTHIPNFEVKGFKFSQQKKKLPVAKVELELELRRLATVSGKRLFISPNLLNRSNFIAEKSSKRKSIIIEDFGYIDFDTVRLHLPENLYPEFLPAPIKIESRFGMYESNFKFDAGIVIYTRRLKVNKGKFPPEAYGEYGEFYKNLNKSDNIKLVFLNKT